MGVAETGVACFFFPFLSSNQVSLIKIVFFFFFLDFVLVVWDKVTCIKLSGLVV